DSDSLGPHGDLCVRPTSREPSWPTCVGRVLRPNFSSMPNCADTSSGETARPVAPHRPLAEFYPEPAVRDRFVTPLFDECARDYDWTSRLLSLGSDRRYRKRALQRAGLKPGMRLLDVASGTGLMIEAALELGVIPGCVCGVD